MSVDVDQISMLVWADADVSVDAVETSARREGLTLSPAGLWARSFDVRSFVSKRLAYRLNPATARIEDMVNAFAYEWHGQNGRTISAPREACGPELRTLLYDVPERIRRVQLRLLPAQPETWLRATAADPLEAQRFVRALLRQAVCPRHVWSELGTVYLSFAGAMADVYMERAMDVASELRLQSEAGSEPKMPELLLGAPIRVETWESLGARDSIALADAWAVLAR